MAEATASDPSPRILLVRRSSLGDIIVTLPALVALRRHLPEAHLTWLVEEQFADLLRGHECLDEIITVRRYSARQPGKWLQETRQVGRYLREQDFDLVLDVHGLFKSAVMCYLSDAPRRLSLQDSFLGLPGLRMINEVVPCRPGIHAVDRALQMASHLGAPPQLIEFRLPIQPEARAWAEELVAEAELAGQPLIGLVLGTSKPNKRWPPEYFAQLTELLREEGRAEVVLIGGSAEREPEAQVQSALSVPAASAVGKTDLKQLSALLAQTSVVVAGDTGALHIAGALERPVVGLYGPTSPLLTGPYGSKHIVLWDQLSCSPCGRRPSCRDYDCMRQLTPQRVAKAVEELLQR